jgi:hypothetical protein
MFISVSKSLIVMPDVDLRAHLHQLSEEPLPPLLA